MKKLVILGTVALLLVSALVVLASCDLKCPGGKVSVPGVEKAEEGHCIIDIDFANDMISVPSAAKGCSNKDCAPVKYVLDVEQQAIDRGTTDTEGNHIKVKKTCDC